jgi:phage FluMu protein Com
MFSRATKGDDTMSIISKIFGNPPRTSTPKFLRKEQHGKNTYELYQGWDAESARQFLLTKQVDKQFYYIVVETPEGNWGMDIQGLYLERLLPWQLDSGSADCTGQIILMSWNNFGLEMAAKKLNDNFIVKIECGSCGSQWLDGVRFQNMTAVRCPACKKVNQVSSDDIKAVFI